MSAAEVRGLGARLGHRDVLGDQAVEACLFSQFHHCG